MPLDIAIVAAIGFTQLVLAWYGVHVSVKKKRTRNAVTIGLVGGLGITFTIWGALRNDKAQQSLRNQLDRIQHNTEKPQPAPIVNVSPAVVNIPQRPEHTTVEWMPPVGVKDHPLLPLHEGEKPTFSLRFRNAGDFSFSTIDRGVTVTLIPAAELRGAFKRYYGGIKRGGSMGTMVPSRQGEYDYIYRTYFGPVLTATDVEKLKSGEVDMCAIGSVRWKDTTGRYDTFLFTCMFQNSDKTTFNWAVMPENNSEHKY
jgi:hypothetical protein